MLVRDWLRDWLEGWYVIQILMFHIQFFQSWIAFFHFWILLYKSTCGWKRWYIIETMFGFHIRILLYHWCGVDWYRKARPLK
jgi:hypothetical protein